MRTDSAKTIYLKDYRPPEYLVETVELSFDLQDEVTLVTSSLKIRRNPASESVDPPLKLDGEGLQLVELNLDDSPLASDAYDYDGACLTIESVPEQFTLTSQVEIKPQENTALEGLYRSNKLYCTQCEAEGFRRITFFPIDPM